MTKEDIYDKIEYNGKYNTKIKTNLRNLIKENKGNDEIYSVLLEVQDELETGKAKTYYNRSKNKKVDDIVGPKENSEITPIKEKKAYVKKEKIKKKSVKKKKKKSSSASIIAKIFIILMALLMIASSVSTIFSYFR